MKTVYFYGDSNTEGYDPRGYGGHYPDDKCWTELVSRALAGRWRVVADGMNGREIPREGGASCDILKHRLSGVPDLTLFAVMLGTNDILDMSVPDADMICHRMKKFLSDIALFLAKRGRNTSIAIVIPPPIEIAGPEAQAFVRAMESLQEMYRRSAAQNGYACIDTAGWKPDLAFDGVHLSESGHAQFADGMVQALKEWEKA